MLAIPYGVLRYIPENLPETEALTPLGLRAFFSMSAIVSPFTRPVAVNPLIVFVKPSKAVEPDSPITVALALEIEPLAV